MIDPKHEQSLRQNLDVVLQGNRQAIDACVLLFGIAQVWDDIIDGESVAPETANRAFIAALVELPTNPIAQMMPELPYHIYNVFLRWRDATAIENNKPSDSDLHKCYMLRAGLYDIFVLIAAKLYGDDYAAHVGPMVRRMYGEDFNDYSKEFK